MHVRETRKPRLHRRRPPSRPLVWFLLTLTLAVALVRAG
jgi:hypothetical protein